jgi:hypothetical protein
VLDRAGQADQVVRIGVVDDRHHQALVGRGRDADVVVPLEYDLALGFIERSIQQGKLLQRGDQRAQDVGDVSELDAFLLRLRLARFAVGGDGAHVDLGDERELRHGARGHRHVLGDALAQPAQRHALLERTFDRHGRRRPVHVVERNAAVRAGASDGRQVEPLLLRQLTRGGHDLGARPRSGRCGLDGCFRRRTRNRDVGSDGLLPPATSISSSTPPTGIVAPSPRQSRNPPRARRGNLDGRLVGQNLDQRLVLGDGVADLDEPLDDLGLGHASPMSGSLN